MNQNRIGLRQTDLAPALGAGWVARGSELVARGWEQPAGLDSWGPRCRMGGTRIEAGYGLSVSAIEARSRMGGTRIGAGGLQSWGSRRWLSGKPACIAPRGRLAGGVARARTRISHQTAGTSLGKKNRRVPTPRQRMPSLVTSRGGDRDRAPANTKQTLRHRPKERRGPTKRAPGPTEPRPPTKSAGLRHRDRRSLAKTTQGPNTESAGPPGPTQTATDTAGDRRAAGPRHKAPDPDTDRAPHTTRQRALWPDRKSAGPRHKERRAPIHRAPGPRHKNRWPQRFMGRGPRQTDRRGPTAAGWIFLF